jgi:hypothetical protein
MSNYTEGFTSTTGDTVDAAELETEFDAIAAAISSKLDSDGTGAMTGNLNMGSNKITSVTDPTDAQDAATKAYADARHATGTEVATTSGTTASFTGIAAGAKHIVLAFSNVSTDNASSILTIQLGDSGGLETTGYTSYTVNNTQTSTVTSNPAAFRINNSNDPTTVYQGQASLIKMSDHVWQCTGSMLSLTGSNLGVWFFGGVKSLTAELDRVQVNCATAGAFDLGSINITVHS